MNDPLPSWRPGPTRERLVSFLEASVDVPAEDKLALFDNDGTLWCERPSYVQLDFFLDELGRAVKADPSVAEKEELAALLSKDDKRMAEIGMERIALALAGLFEGRTPEEFVARAREFLGTATHAGLKRPMPTVVYRPMLELIDALRSRGFTVGVVSGGGTEFVRAISHQLYGVPPELVVGTLIEYELEPDSGSGPVLRRTANVHGAANEGPAKVTHIQRHLGRAPLFAAGNSAGDLDMLAWAHGRPGGLALLVDHDDAEREYAYASEAVTFEAPEPITDTAARSGWCVVSMADDWDSVFD